MQLFQEYGLAAAFIIISAGFLIRYIMKMWPVWTERDRERIKKLEFSLQEELSSHQFFSNIMFKINSEIHTLDFNSNKTPVRHKLFRKLIEVRLQSTHDMGHRIISENMEKFTASQWSNFILSANTEADIKFEEEALKAGIPSIVVKKFLVWQHQTDEIFIGYVRDLAVSTVYGTNIARTNTLLYLMNLKMTTTVGDAERTLVELNGEITGLNFNGETIEDM